MAGIDRRKASNRSAVFQIGGLRFGVHGLLGLLCLCLTEGARRYYSESSPNTASAALLLWLSQLCNAFLATHAVSLLSQVPAYTQIIPGVVAPHKEAFQRTMACMHYLVPSMSGRPLLALVPSWNLPISNGNTWIFVIPIFVGVSGDLWQYIYWGDCIPISQLLQVQLVGLLLSFGFTLAFRNYVPMPLVYFLAAWRVWEILREGIASVQASAYA